MLSVVIILGSLDAGVAAAANPWRYPFQPGTSAILTKGEDGLPDFKLFYAKDSDVLTNKTSACPAQLRRPCCREKDGENGKSCCKDYGMHKCGGGMWCEIDQKVVKEYPSIFPYGKISSGSSSYKVVNRTRRNILERAIGWLAINTPYMGNCGVPKTEHGFLETCAADDAEECPKFAFTADCRGFVSMAQGLGGGNAGDYRYEINCTDLLPGDSLHRVGGKGKSSEHSLLFRSWDNKAAKSMKIYQLGGGGHAAPDESNVNMAILSYKGHEWCTQKGQPYCMRCYRNRNVIETDDQLDSSVHELHAGILSV